MENRPFRPYRSFFWPILLIGVGLVWLLGNLGLIQGNSLSLLGSLWPVILIAVGLDLLVGRGSPVVGAVIGLLLIAVLVGALIAGPALGLKTPNGNFRVERFSSPLDSASSSDVRINSGSEPVSIRALNDSNQLIDATIGHYGTIDFNVSGDKDKVVTLSHNNASPVFNFNFGDLKDLRWDIGLSPNVPTRLELSSGSGSVDLNLSGMKMNGVLLDSGSGSVNVVLSETTQPYTAEIHSGSGSVNVQLPANTDVTLRTDSGSGSVNVRLPSNTAVRVEVSDHGSGSVSIGGGLSHVSGSDKEGTWESQGYAQAAHKILIQVVGMGSGSLSIH